MLISTKSGFVNCMVRDDSYVRSNSGDGNGRDKLGCNVEVDTFVPQSNTAHT